MIGFSRGGLRWTLSAIAIAVSLLSWLFLNADAVSAQAHEHYGREIRLLRQADAELNAAVLANRVGLQTDFDTIVAAVNALQQDISELAQAPDFLAPNDRRLVLEKVAEYQSVLHNKAQQIDLFKREHSVLRNSLAYLPLATDRLVDDPNAPIALTRPIGIFVRGVMTHAHATDDAFGNRLEQKLVELERQLASIQGSYRERFRNVLMHGRVVLERKRIIDTVTRETLAMPTARLSEELAGTYAEGYQRASRKAHDYRLSLYVLALVLAGYLALAMMRLARTSSDLALANRQLEERIAALDRTQSDLKLYATVFTNASEGMLITDGRGRIEATNPAFSEITGYAAAEMLGHSPAMLKSGRQADNFYRDMWRTLDRRGQWQGEIWNRRKSGEIYPEWLSITAVKGEAGKPNHFIGLFSDITERKKAEARIHHLAHHDTLTNLPNRALLQDRIEQAILQARRSNSHTAVLLLNLDRFKTINDSLGHDLGDGLLQQVALRCQSQVRESDTVARPGSDEFVIVIPEIAHPHDAANIARKLLASVSRPYLLGEHEIRVTASVGIAIFDGDGRTPAELLRNADAAMYRAKAEGRNAFQFYSADMNSASLGDLLLENQLRGALDRGELELHYQPKVCTETGNLVGAEALLRWRHPELGLIAPGRFVPVAEESGLIVPIGEWVLREACRQLKAWRDAGLMPVPVAVNLSAQQFMNRQLAFLVEDVLAEAKLPAGLLGLELTETMLMRDVDRTIETLSALRSMGIDLSIDDFGTGYSSLAYLKQFSVNILKIDRSFVNDIHRENADGKIAAAVIALAHSLGMKVVAEGVETDAQRDFLHAHGCDQLQGYLFGRPITAADFELKLAARRSGLPTAPVVPLKGRLSGI
ncbi:EAL domain-containing protein [Azoarcus sp. L1K30]|nr:EAL domain-containing protein [Azoarcus sp. L1K30]MBR0565177.1 EAL domain-containing protein [Azoarcus sp. L1K30]